ncbi:cation-translocating P-type ATPase [Candidatus Phytoplasma pini]|uniref:P-type ATPase n=1 Tax=Candidatus Phytoplasma pini TaxID=267362 RepID=A0A559KJ34_9MOLU|nr:cation-transporting P-type ATPase [Candidatus Phytoplasma pini]TVY12145.1 P-type ATPase [Candidatus Phytoplasma pini]
MDSFLYQCHINLLETKLKTNFIQGLNTSQVKEKLLIEGLNKLVKNKKISLWKKILQQFRDLFVCILLLSAIITFFIGIIYKQQEEIFESILILIIVFINIFLNLFYEKQKKKSLKLVKEKTKPYARVVRDGVLQLVLKEELVVGDIVFVETGDVVPADIRIIQSNNLKVDESILTGETASIIKEFCEEKNGSFDLFNSYHLIFRDTTVIYGNSKGVVVYTGKKTQIGKITKFIFENQDKKSPLEENIQQLTKFLSLLILFLVGFNFIINLSKNYFTQKNINFFIIQKLFLISIALAVAVIPESLLTIITIILTIGVKKLLSQKTIIKKLRTLETLGSINIICTDKTGTLTENKMKIQNLYFFHQNVKINKSLKHHELSQIIIKLITYGILCNSHDISFSIKPNIKNLIDPIDQSFIDLAYFLNLNIYQMQSQNVKIKEFPFDSKHKLMITIHKNNKGCLLVVKGAAELILRLSSFIEKEENQIIKKNKINEKIIEENSNLIASQEGYKILGVAYSFFDEKILLSKNLSINDILEKINKNLIFLGIYCIEDPIRAEILPIIKELKKASIIPIMITGDNLYTAQNVAYRLKIFDYKTDLAITGTTLDQWSEKEFLKKLPFIKVYARTNPEHKLKIIQTLQKKGNIVAMIGDGVNDAVSIKKADVGIAMGITGTEITKKASDMILTNDDFTTVKTAIFEGRNIFKNIQKSILFLLSCNTGEIIVILYNTILGHFLFKTDLVILTAFQILWINLITDSLVAVALGMEPPEKNLMQEKPRNIKTSFLNKKLILKIIAEGFMIGSSTFLSAWIGYKIHGNSKEYAQTFAFTVLIFSQLIHVFNLRNLKKSIFKIKPNWYLRKFFFLSCFLQIMLFVIPFLQQKFQLYPLSKLDIFIIFMFSFVPLIISEIIKKIFFKK